MYGENKDAYLWISFQYDFSRWKAIDSRYIQICGEFDLVDFEM